MTQARAFVLLSGGINSAVVLRQALEQYDGGDVEAMWLDYVIPQHTKPKRAAQAQCQTLGILFEERILVDLFRPLQDPRMIFFGAWHAMRWVTDVSKPAFMIPQATLWWGAHTEPAPHDYPRSDHHEFIAALTNVIRVATRHTVSLRTPLQWTRRHDIVRQGQAMGIDWANTWSCQLNGEHPCGICPPCHARRQAFERAEVMDPLALNAARAATNEE